jgi:hypothetical protein
VAGLSHDLRLAENLASGRLRFFPAIRGAVILTRATGPSGRDIVLILIAPAGAMSELARDGLRERHDGLTTGRGPQPRPGNGYPCCQGGECPQHEAQRLYDASHWWLGRSQADRDEI